MGKPKDTTTKVVDLFAALKKATEAKRRAAHSVQVEGASNDSRTCDHKFIGPPTCAHCGVHVDELRRRDEMGEEFVLVDTRSKETDR